MKNTELNATFYYRLWGDRAMFTDVTKAFEATSYSVPTYSALKSITDNIYWKPALNHIVEEVIVINPIKRITEGQLHLGYTPAEKLNHSASVKFQDSSKLTRVSYLTNVEYLVKVRMIWNPDALEGHNVDKNATKHINIFQRALNSGGRLPIYLGRKECKGYVEPITAQNFDTARSCYSNVDIDFGTMFHSFDFPETYIENENEMPAYFDDVSMESGLIKFRTLREIKIEEQNTRQLKHAVYKNFTNYVPVIALPVKQELEEDSA